MPIFTSYDGTELAYSDTGAGEPLLCLPGGPMRPVGYQGDLGGLGAGRRLIQLEHRGNGASGVPADPGTYRVDRMVGDVEALRRHLGLERFALLGHSAGANLAILYAEAYPERVTHLVLVTPSTWVVGVAPDAEDTRAALLARKDEPWFAEAFAASERLDAGAPLAGDEGRFEPFWHGRWDEAARRTAYAPEFRIPEGIYKLHYAQGCFDAARTRAALAALTLPTLILVGGVDFSPTLTRARRLAELFAADRVTLTVQPDAGHYPWEDDADRFRGIVAGWLEAH